MKKTTTTISDQALRHRLHVQAQRVNHCVRCLCSILILIVSGILPTTMNGAVLHAYLDVREKGFSIREAALQHGVAKSTLHDRLSGPIPNKKEKPTLDCNFV